MWWMVRRASVAEHQGMYRVTSFPLRRKRGAKLEGAVLRYPRFRLPGRRRPTLARQGRRLGPHPSRTLPFRSKRCVQPGRGHPRLRLRGQLQRPSGKPEIGSRGPCAPRLDALRAHQRRHGDALVTLLRTETSAAPPKQAVTLSRAVPSASPRHPRTSPVTSAFACPLRGVPGRWRPLTVT